MCNATKSHTHMVIKTNSRFGQFSYEAEADVDDAQLKQLASFGLLQVLQRSPSSAAEKAMAGYEKRPSGFERDSIPFNEANAGKLEAALSAVEVKEGGEVVLTLVPTVVVSQYVAPEGTDGFAGARKLYVNKGGDLARLAKLAAAVEYDGEIGDGKEAPAEFLTAIKAWLKG